MSALNDQFWIFLSGSSSEIYIRPGHPCLNDIDLMCIRKDCIALFNNDWVCRPVDACYDVTTVTTLSTELLTDRNVSVDPGCRTIFKSVILEEGPSRFSGHGWTESKGDIVQISDKRMMFLRFNGFAVTLGCSRSQDYKFDKPDSSVDFVEAIRCRNWPIKMTDWFNRKPKFDRPNKELKKKVIEGGCHIIASRNETEK